MQEFPPKVFVSYSWTTPAHQETVKSWSDRLLADGVDVVFDVYDLKEGDDKYNFMERMVTDDSVTHVLVVCDKEYAEKADNRKAGVGTESQIISKGVYEKVKQSKFIPVVCEYNSDGNPHIPTFLGSRIFLDFSSPESANENWERLIRLLFGKPLHKKPKVGKPPFYIAESSANPSGFSSSAYLALRQSIYLQRADLEIQRAQFLDECFQYADSLRIRVAPKDGELGARIVGDCSKLKDIRNYIVNWILLEARARTSIGFSEVLIDLLERLRELKSRPPEVRSWSDEWFEAQSIFVYETFLYIVAALIVTKDFRSLNEVFTTHYLVPESDRYSEVMFSKFDCFYGYSMVLHEFLTDNGRRYHCPAAELIKRQADRQDIKFEAIMEAELVVLLMTFLTPDTYWYPGTLNYAPYMHKFPLFLKATRHKEFRQLAVLTGLDSVEELRESVRKGQESQQGMQMGNLRYLGNFLGMMNLDNLDTLK